MHRPNEREFLAEVLRDIEDLPDGLAERLLELVHSSEANRAAAIRELLEEYSRD